MVALFVTPGTGVVALFSAPRAGGEEQEESGARRRVSRRWPYCRLQRTVCEWRQEGGAVMEGMATQLQMHAGGNGKAAGVLIMGLKQAIMRMKQSFPEK